MLWWPIFLKYTRVVTYNLFRYANGQEYWGLSKSLRENSAGCGSCGEGNAVLFDG